MSNLLDQFARVLKLVAISIIALSVNLFAQSELTYKGGSVIQNGLPLQPKQVRVLMADHTDALKSYNAGRAFTMTGRVFSYPGAFIFGYDLGTRLAGGEGDNTLLVVGATGCVVGLLIELYGMSKVKKSVSLYNSKTSNGTASYQINFGLTQTGVGFNILF